MKSLQNFGMNMLIDVPFKANSVLAHRIAAFTLRDITSMKMVKIRQRDDFDKIR